MLCIIQLQRHRASSRFDGYADQRDSGGQWQQCTRMGYVYTALRAVLASPSQPRAAFKSSSDIDK